jgi:hypothetical protein
LSSRDGNAITDSTDVSDATLTMDPMAAKKRVKANAKPKSITLRAPSDIWEMLQDIGHLRSRKIGKQQSTNAVLLGLIKEEYGRHFEA